MISYQRMAKPTVYLETTVPSYIFNDQYPDRQAAAKAVFNLIKEGKFQAFVSEAVIQEISATKEPKRTKIEKLIKNLPVLPVTRRVRELAEEYIKEGVFPKTKTMDATHVAVASINKIDYLLSWNLEHIVKIKTKEKVGAINTLKGYKTPIIAIPEEVI